MGCCNKDRDDWHDRNRDRDFLRDIEYRPEHHRKYDCDMHSRYTGYNDFDCDRVRMKIVRGSY